MSNLDVRPAEATLSPGQPCSQVEIIGPRQVPLGGPRAMTVHRTLPSKQRPLVGAWCFLDHYGPDPVSQTGGMVVPRHPHTGLATVSWLFEGEIDHLDSAGNSARVVPGELNLMSAGRGITHEEISTPATGSLAGVQLWFALPGTSRFSTADFQHFVPEPVAVAGGSIKVFIGAIAGSSSPVVTRTDELLGSELMIEADGAVHLGIRSDFEYAVLAVDGDLAVNGTDLPHRSLAYVPRGATALEIGARSRSTRGLLLGGIPFNEPVVMWWNFLGRTHEEIVEFRRRYQAEMGFEASDPRDNGKPALFGEFPSGRRPALPAPPLANARLRPRNIVQN